MFRVALFSAVTMFCVATVVAAEFTIDRNDAGVTVKIDGKPLTTYLIKSGSKPILYPVIGPTGKAVTRNHPMTKAGPGERSDHPHHRSLWFTHGNVNGHSFWHEKKGDKGPQIVHKEFLKVAGGKQAVISTRNEWVAPNGKVQCEDIRTLTFHADAKRRMIDFNITVKAKSEKVTFGDTKEGSFGIRVAGTMKVDAKKGGKIINSEGQTDKKAWGKPAAWVDYHGPVEGETVGVAILNHPSSFRYPSHWHVRTYGLFAANPFGMKHFTGKPVGAHTLEPGQSFSLRYRVVLHEGDEKKGDIAKAFAAYSKEKK